MRELIDFMLIVGAISYLTTLLVAPKDGPFKIMWPIRHLFSYLGTNNPLRCFFCTTPWVSLAVLAAWSMQIMIIQAIIAVFGFAGIALAVRSMYQEWTIAS